LSDLPWQDGCMTTDESIQPREWDTAALRKDIEEWQAHTAAIVQALQNGTTRDESANWWPHREQIIAGLQWFVDLCDEELQAFGTWNEQELAASEIHELIWWEGDRLVAWVQRLIGTEVGAREQEEKTGAGDGI
jgi:hypothetical protein